MTTLRILAVGAHPDDLELLCAGTLARYAADGHTVIMAHLLNGDKGHYEMDSAELAAVRKAEADAAGRVIGAEVVGLDLPDGELCADLETRRAVIDLIRDARPDLIITHAPGDYTSDHTEASRVVCDASFFAAAPLMKTRVAAHDKIVPVFFMDTLAGMGFLPTEYVDITDVFDRKIAMLEAHQSQLTWLKGHHGSDILDFVETTARFRGVQCGVRYAEGFRQFEVWGRKLPKRLLP